jgi:predicted dehydrogenase
MLLAGVGAFGSEHLGRLIGRADVSIVGVADTNSAALAEVRSLHGVSAYDGNALNMVDQCEADALIVATPAASHVEICTHALARGLCVLLEKPVAMSAEGGRALLDLERGSRAFVLPGHVLRFSRSHQLVVDIVRSGQIGNAIYLNSRRYRDDDHAVRFVSDDPILTTLIHDIDLARWITDSDFRSVLARRIGGPGYRSITIGHAMTANGVACDLRTAWTFSDGNLPPDRLEVVGVRGSVELVVGKGVRVHHGGRRHDLPEIGADDSLRNEQDHFVSCVRNRSLKRVIDLPQAIAGLRLADAMAESLRLRREVVLSD